MRGHIDTITPTSILGWAMEALEPSTPLEVRLLVEGNVLATTIANLPRHDVGKVYGTKGNHGFEFRDLPDTFAGPKGIENIRLEGKLPGNDAWLLISTTEEETDKSPEENFRELLGRLQLIYLENSPSRKQPLGGLSVLHLDCGDGSLCAEAFKLGAASVVGIDGDINNVLAARENAPQATILRGNAWNLPNEKYDVIFLLSGLEREPKPGALMQHLAHHLKPDGTLVLQCGVGNTQKKNWYVVEEEGQIVRYPNFDVLSRDILRHYAWRDFGSYTSLGTSAVPRVILHCRQRSPMAILISGATRSGKTTLSLTMADMGLPIVHLDGLIGDMMSHPRYNWSPVADVVRQVPKSKQVHFGEIGEAIINAGLAKEFAEVIVQECPKDSDLFGIEGEILRHDSMYEALLEKLGQESIRTWLLAPPSGRG